MADYGQMSLTTRLFMKSYPFSRHTLNPVPCAGPPKPLKESTLALITTAGLHIPGQKPFDRTKIGGDTSFREIPADVAVSSLIESHRSPAFDHSGLERDRNLAFPLDRFRELAAAGLIGRLSDRHFSFMGSIAGPRTLIRETAPAVARLLIEDEVDAVFLTPV